MGWACRSRWEMDLAAWRAGQNRSGAFYTHTLRRPRVTDGLGGYFGLGYGLGGIARLSRAKTRSISAENPTGEKGRGGMATEGTGAQAARGLPGQGWKVSPSIQIPPASTATLAEIAGPGAIQHVWLTCHPQ